MWNFFNDVLQTVPSIVDGMASTASDLAIQLGIMDPVVAAPTLGFNEAISQTTGIPTSVLMAAEGVLAAETAGLAYQGVQNIRARRAAAQANEAIPAATFSLTTPAVIGGAAKKGFNTLSYGYNSLPSLRRAAVQPAVEDHFGLSDELYAVVKDTAEMVALVQALNEQTLATFNKMTPDTVTAVIAQMALRQDSYTAFAQMQSGAKEVAIKGLALRAGQNLDAVVAPVPMA